MFLMLSKLVSGCVYNHHVSLSVILEASLHPMNDPLTSTPAALAYIAQFVEIIAFVLDQPLLFTLPRPVAIR